VIREELSSTFSAIADRFQFRKPFLFAPGGAERQDSVWNGLAALPESVGVVAIQDAARPCTSQNLIRATVSAARETGAAVAAQPVTDTIKESDNGEFIKGTLDRNRLWAVQTPQSFRADIIRRALTEVRRQGIRITDDTAACELIGQPVRLVVSVEPNPKVTRREDLPIVEAVLRGMLG